MPLVFLFGAYVWIMGMNRMPTLGMNVKPSLVDMSKVRPNVGGSSGVSPSSMSSGLDGWDGISLDYTVDWPLQLFFTQDVLSK